MPMNEQIDLQVRGIVAMLTSGIRRIIMRPWACSACWPMR
jgi:hypothetical protein